MIVEEIANKLNLTVFGGRNGLTKEVTFGYSSDLMSDVMGNADAGNLWITLQTHRNVLAIASLKELAGVVIVKGLRPDEDMLTQCEAENIPVLGTFDETFVISGKLFQLLTT